MMPTAVSIGRATAFGDGAAEQDGGAGKDEQRQRMAEPPGQAVLDDVADMAAARGDAGDGRDMIGFERMLHAQQKPEPQNSEHVSPARTQLLPGSRRAKQRSHPNFVIPGWCVSTRPGFEIPGSMLRIAPE